MIRLVTGLMVIIITLGAVGLYREQTTSANPAESSVIGSWRRLSGESGVGVTNLYTFFADGTAISVDRDGATWLGAWRFAGENQIAFTLEAVNQDGTGMGQSLTFELGANPDEIPFGPDVLQRIVPDA